MNAAALQMQYKKMVYEKTAANRATLNDALKENFLFKGLDGDQMTTLLDAMFMANFEAGKAIIEQGAEGDNFYVVFEGECEVFVSKGGDEKMVLACGKGDSFGELALMANAPRAATVRAKTDCVLFAVDRIVQVHPDGRRRSATCTTPSSRTCRSWRPSPSTRARRSRTR